MSAQVGKNFIVFMVVIGLVLGGFTWIASEVHSRNSAQPGGLDTASLQTSAGQTPSPATSPEANRYPVSDNQSPNQGGAPDASMNGSNTPGYDAGYRAGYQDGLQGCDQGRGAYGSTSRYRSPGRVAHASYLRRGVAGETYYAPRRRRHSTRNMILTVAAPAALAAGIGGIAGGGKGAGIGALIGGGGGALYYLLKHRNR
ncbi:MAG TPA: hypothetical protein VJX67_08090 [Blastocatellia bacterium]|nr:hypothetical protein [Blastocatellia bacterium]